MQTTPREAQRSDLAPGRGFTAIGALVVVVASAAAAVGFAARSRPAFILPIVAGGGLALTALAVMRFELFVAAILLIRATLDAAKIGSSSVDAAGAISLLFIVAGSVWLAAQRREPRVDPSPFVRPFVALVSAGALSVVSSSYLLDSAIELVRMATVVVIFATLNRLLVDWRRIRLIVGVVFASSIIPITVAAYQLLTGRAFYYPGGFRRLTGTFLHPNPFAAYLFLLIVLGAGIYPHLERRLKPLMLALLASYAVLLIATYARGAWIATVIGLMIVGLMQHKRALLILVTVIVVAVIVAPSIRDRFSDLSEDIKPSGASGNSLAWRFQYWGQILSLQENPLFGIGLRGVELSTDVEKAPHNDLIRVYVETGILGLLAYIWLFVVLIREARRALARARPGLARGVALAYSGALAGFLLLSLVGNLISQLVILWYFATIAATAVATSRLAPERSMLVP